MSNEETRSWNELAADNKRLREENDILIKRGIPDTHFEFAKFVVEHVLSWYTGHAAPVTSGLAQSAVEAWNESEYQPTLPAEDER